MAKQKIQFSKYNLVFFDKGNTSVHDIAAYFTEYVFECYLLKELSLQITFYLYQ